MKGLDIWTSTFPDIYYYGETGSEDRTNQIYGEVHAYLSYSSMCRKSNLYGTKKHFYILHKYFSEKIIHQILEKVCNFDSSNAKPETPLMGILY